MLLDFVHRTLSRALLPRKSLATEDASSGEPLRAPALPASSVEALSDHNEFHASAALSSIASAAVKLAALGPDLARLAAEMEQAAHEQADRANDIASTMDALTGSLDKAVKELRVCSTHVGESLATVARIADHTRIISINASIEAARAGEQGKTFAVVVEEVQRLADRTGHTAHEVEERINGMQTSIKRVERVSGTNSATLGPLTGVTPPTATDNEALSIGAVSTQVHSMAASASQQRSGAKALSKLGEVANDFSEALLLSVGRFRFALHAKAEQDAGMLIDALPSIIGDRHACEALFEEWLAAHPHFELAYLTDPDGKQIVDNIRRTGDAITHDPCGFGRDWSERPWFLLARNSFRIQTTDIYRSTATKDFCFTISAAIRSPDGKLLGVIGTDVNFTRLVEEQDRS